MDAEWHELHDALTIAQKAIAMVIDPNAVKSTSVLHAWARLVEAEAIARQTLGKGARSSNGEG